MAWTYSGLMTNCKDVDSMVIEVQTNTTANLKKLKEMNIDLWKTLKKKVENIILELEEFMNTHILSDAQVDDVCAKLGRYRKIANQLASS